MRWGIDLFVNHQTALILRGGLLLGTGYYGLFGLIVSNKFSGLYLMEDRFWTNLSF